MPFTTRSRTRLLSILSPIQRSPFCLTLSSNTTLIATRFTKGLRIAIEA